MYYKPQSWTLNAQSLNHGPAVAVDAPASVAADTALAASAADATAAVAADNTAVAADVAAAIAVAAEPTHRRGRCSGR